MLLILPFYNVVERRMSKKK